MLRKTESYSNLQKGFPLSKNAGNWYIKNNCDGRIEQGVFKNTSGSMLDLYELQIGGVNIPSKKAMPPTRRYRFFKDDFHGVIANLNLIEKNNNLVADGHFTACVYFKGKPYSIEGEFEDHKIISIKSKDSVFPGNLDQLIGKPGHYAVHDFLEKKFSESINAKNHLVNQSNVKKMLMLTGMVGFSLFITISILLNLSGTRRINTN